MTALDWWIREKCCVLFPGKIWIKSKYSKARIDLALLAAGLSEKVGMMWRALSISRARSGACVREASAKGIDRLLQAYIMDETAG